MYNPKSIFVNLRELLNLAWKPVFCSIVRSLTSMLEEVVFAVIFSSRLGISFHLAARGAIYVKIS